MDATRFQAPGRVGRWLSAALTARLMLGAAAVCAQNPASQPATAPPAQDPASQPAVSLTSRPAPPAAAPATCPVDQILRQVEALASPDADLRASAVETLMNLSMEDLPALKWIVGEEELLPGQLALLREVVAQVYLSNQPYPAAKEGDPPRTPPFLGLNWGTQFDDVPLDASGLRVARRFPGFPGNQAFRPGDCIVSIVEQPDKVVNSSSFKDLIKVFRPDQTIHLNLIRQGKAVQVAVTLRSKPQAASDVVNMDQFQTAREASAETFWNQQFVPLIEKKTP